jgi:hypothetical protein
LRGIFLVVPTFCTETGGTAERKGKFRKKKSSNEKKSEKGLDKTAYL